MSKTKTRAENLEGVVKAAQKQKNDAIKAATEPLGICCFVAFAILVLLIAPPSVILLLT